MNSVSKDESVKIKRLVSWYNAISNVFWSVVNLTPIWIFCYKYLDLKLLYEFLAISLLTVLLPRSFFNRIQLAKTRSVYVQLGVPFVNKLTQNGVIINRLIRKKYPHYNVISTRKRSVEYYYKKTYLFEKFHFIFFIFFTITTIYALINQHFLWVLILMVTNILYNIYPNLLQQYIRVRLIKIV